MVNIGGKPILWHIMKIYSFYGFNEFVIALGYKGDVIKDYFLNYYYHVHGITINLSSNDIIIHDNGDDDHWVVHLLDTGVDTKTGGRIRQIIDFIGDETFMLTYGDGVANIDINKLLRYHKNSQKLATVTAVHPASRYGEIKIFNGVVDKFKEKPQIDDGWINGGFFVLEPEVVKHISGNQTIWEQEPMNNIVKDHQLAVYCHNGFWQCMDSLRDVQTLETQWQSGEAKWKVW
jgi:glucose-1-phosphate cytidylyltransferase